MKVTPENVRNLWSHMADRYNVSVTRKRDAWIMRVAGKILPTPGFLDSYVTTLWGRIYVPFTVGDDAPFIGADGTSHVWSLESQAAVVAHECQHLVQERRDGSWRYSWRYATSTAARAAYETEAYRATLEMKWALGADGWDLHQEAIRHATGLKNYGCSAVDVGVAGITLGLAVDEITRGVVKTEAAHAALSYLLG